MEENTPMIIEKTEEPLKQTNLLVENDVAKEGDVVVAFFSKNKVVDLKLERGKTFQTKWGIFHHEDIIGKKIGTKISSRKENEMGKIGFFNLTLPTCELFTNGFINHKTQIIHTPDISIITFMLELKNGRYSNKKKFVFFLIFFLIFFFFLFNILI